METNVMPSRASLILVSVLMTGSSGEKGINWQVAKVLAPLRGIPTIAVPMIKATMKEIVPNLRMGRGFLRISAAMPTAMLSMMLPAFLPVLAQQLDHLAMKLLSVLNK
jgi:hypothetical protein